jgi:FMN phosphatase YigB (HAD superfamily)
MKLNVGVIETLRELKKKGIKIAMITDLTTNIQLRN